MLKQRGISLLEVLISIFVVGIGLLGVLAVIPFGVYQVSKANHAGYASNMLVNAAEEIVIRGMAKRAAGLPSIDDVFWIEPYERAQKLKHITHTTVDPKWQEVMCGQDDFEFETGTGDRPVFNKFIVDEDGNPVKPMSTGGYTWFFTFLPIEGRNSVTVDVLACYKRLPEDDVQVPVNDFSPSWKGGTFTFPDASLIERLTQTKYVFVTWMETSELKEAWCEIVFLDKDERSVPRTPRLVVTGGLPDSGGVYSDMYIYIPSGVLYHKQVRRVPIR